MKILSEHLNKYRLRDGSHGSNDSYGMTGAFLIPGPFNRDLRIISSGHSADWEHVSVSTENRCPNWPEMCFIKDLFWNENEVVVQYHPAKKNYVNAHPYCLHLWKPKNEKMPLPPLTYV